MKRDKKILYKDENDMFYVIGDNYYHATKEDGKWYEKLSSKKEFDDFMLDIGMRQSNANGGLWGIW